MCAVKMMSFRRILVPCRSQQYFLWNYCLRTASICIVMLFCNISLVGKMIFVSSYCNTFLLLSFSIIVTNYLAAAGEEHDLEAAMSISPPWNVFESAVSQERPIDTMLFNRILTHHLIKPVRR